MKRLAILCLIVLSSILLAGCSLIKTKDQKYEECITACNLNDECLEWGTKKGYSLSGTDKDFEEKICIKQSAPSCKNTCVEKYK